MEPALTLPDALSSCWLDLGEVQSLLLQRHPGVVLLLTPDGRVLGTNPAGAERLGRSPNASDREQPTLLSPITAEDAAPVLRADALQPGTEHDWMLRHRDGSPQPMRLAMGALRDSRKQLVGLVAVEPWPRSGDDTTPLFQHHDTLTGLPTPAVLADRAEMALQRAARHQTTVALLVARLEGYDTWPRLLADEVLRATASRLHFELRKTDTAVRLDDGPFAVMLVDLHQPDEALQVAAKIRTALSAPVNIDGARHPVHARVGVAWSPLHGDQLLPLIQAAEAALKAEPSDIVSARATAAH